MAQRRKYVSLIVFAAILTSAVWIVHAQANALRALVERHAIGGVVVYLLLNVADALVAPGATLPLIPVVSRVWGHVPTALATMAGWTAGSLLAFFIARRWGVPIVKKLTSMERVNRLRKYIPANLFWSVVVLRAILPMDVISYVLGLFTDMKWSAYTAATAIGLAPSAFLLVYLGRTPRAYTITMAVIGAAVVASLVYSTRRGRSANGLSAVKRAVKRVLHLRSRARMRS